MFNNTLNETQLLLTVIPQCSIFHMFLSVIHLLLWQKIDNPALISL